MGAVFDAQGLTAIQKLVLLAMADNASHDGTRVFPGMPELCLKTSLAARTVRAARSDLRDMGLIILVKPHARRRSPTYRIDMDLLSKAACDASLLPGILAIRSAPDAEREARGAITEARGAVSKAPLTIINRQEPKDKKDQVHAANAADAQKIRVRGILEKHGIDTTDLLSHVGTSRLAQDQIDVSHFPEPYRIVIERFCRLW